MTDLHRALDAVERRVLGCLVEKELSTPDAYPLSGNALLAACNQTTNRDPVLALAAEEVEEALKRLMGDLLVWRERGARVLRWKHLVDEKLRLDVAGKAILAELLLRGPQTPGELRGRSVRMHAFGGLGEVEALLTELRARGLVEELPRAPGQKERRWRELLGEERSGSGPRVAAEEPPQRHLQVGAAAPPQRAATLTPASAGQAARADAAVGPAGSPTPGAGASGGVAAGSARPASDAPAPPRAAGGPEAGAHAAGLGAAHPRPPAATGFPPPAVSPAQLALERRVTQLEQRLAEVLARLAHLEEARER